MTKRISKVKKYKMELVERADNWKKDNCDKCKKEVCAIRELVLYNARMGRDNDFDLKQKAFGVNGTCRYFESK